MIICPICNKEIKNRRGFSIHLGKHKEIKNNLEKETIIANIMFGEQSVLDTIEDYKNEKYCIYNLPIEIGGLINLLGLKRTKKEEHSTKRYKDKYSKSIFEKYGVQNVSQIPEIKEKIRIKTKENYELQKDTMAVGYEYYKKTDKFLETYDKIESNCLEKYGHKNFGCGKNALEKRKISLKETIKSWEYEEKLSRTAKARESVCSRGGYSSKPEKRIRKILIDLNVEAIYNKNLFNYNWDLILPQNIIIEVQGVMWHAKPSVYSETDLIMGKILAKDIWAKDKRKRTKIESEGFKLIEIWEDEINSRNDCDLQILVMERLKENAYNF